MDEASPFMRDWALKWLRGSIESYIRGNTPINMVKGRIKKAMKSYSISIDEIEALINSISHDPLINVPGELLSERVKPLIAFIREIKG